MILGVETQVVLFELQGIRIKFWLRFREINTGKKLA